jgi:hypothetical protein
MGSCCCTGKRAHPGAILAMTYKLSSSLTPLRTRVMKKMSPRRERRTESARLRNTSAPHTGTITTPRHGADMVLDVAVTGPS